MDRIIMEDDAGVMAAALPEERRASRLKFDNILAWLLLLFFSVVSLHSGGDNNRYMHIVVDRRGGVTQEERGVWT
jgi:hypothetical protein